MPRKGKTSITVDDETFNFLSDEKPNGVTWDYFLKTAIKTHPDRKLKEREKSLNDTE